MSRTYDIPPVRFPVADPVIISSHRGDAAQHDRDVGDTPAAQHGAARHVEIPSSNLEEGWTRTLYRLASPP